MSAWGRLAVLAGVCLLALTLSLGSAVGVASRPAAQAKPDLVVTSLIIEASDTTRTS